jgi:glucose-6-phosphate dehydrogenase assembly protein OpcA
MPCSTTVTRGDGSDVVSEDVWTAEDTTPDAVDDALRAMLHERHAANEALAPARVLNMVVIIDADWKGEVANRYARVGRYHASRTVVCAVDDRRRTLDARAVLTYDAEGDGSAVVHEHVVLDIGPEHLRAIDTVVDPLILSELSTLVWSPHGHDGAVESLLDKVDVVLLDSDDDPDPSAGLARAAEWLESAYVVDLAWLRTTPWRERLAASLDPPDRREALAGIATVAIRHQPRSVASGVLYGGWLRSRLKRELDIELEPVEQESPGLAGITVCCGGGFSLSLDRGKGGLTARERALDGTERSWQVLGASRGEGGILGEGVRQALLRDPTYGPALLSARDMLAA